MFEPIQSTILIIIGISGNLARRKLLPAIDKIRKAGMLPEHFRIVGTSRQPIENRPENISADTGVEFVTLDVTKKEDYTALAKRLLEIESSFAGTSGATPTQRLFYLSVPPEAAEGIIQSLGESGLSTVPRTKILLEKPFGRDLKSAERLINTIHTYFAEEQVYRIDHYLAKEMTQNLLVFRAQNSLFRHTWNHTFIKSIEIIASETIGIEGRAAFYEQTGALRDFVQSHLLQLAALVLMDLPVDAAHTEEYWQTVPKKRLEALRDMVLSADPADLVRRQYKGYREEVGNPQSQTETFVSLVLYSKNATWTGVPIHICTGKALAKKTTEIRIQYKPDTSGEANTLTLRIQPHEGVEMCIWIKKPGYAHDVEKHSLGLTYTEHFENVPEAYERVFVDAMRGDHSLFTTSEEVRASWNILAPLQKAWEEAWEEAGAQAKDIEIY